MCWNSCRTKLGSKSSRRLLKIPSLFEVRIRQFFGRLSFPFRFASPLPRNCLKSSSEPWNPSESVYAAHRLEGDYMVIRIPIHDTARREKKTFDSDPLLRMFYVTYYAEKAYSATNGLRFSFPPIFFFLSYDDALSLLYLFSLILVSPHCF